MELNEVVFCCEHCLEDNGDIPYLNLDHDNVIRAYAVCYFCEQETKIHNTDIEKALQTLKPTLYYCELGKGKRVSKYLSWAIDEDQVYRYGACNARDGDFLHVEKYNPENEIHQICFQKQPKKWQKETIKSLQTTPCVVNE